LQWSFNKVIRRRASSGRNSSRRESQVGYPAEQYAAGANLYLSDLLLRWKADVNPLSAMS
jgi:hypothetical protein